MGVSHQGRKKRLEKEVQRRVAAAVADDGDEAASSNEIATKAPSTASSGEKKTERMGSGRIRMRRKNVGSLVSWFDRPPDGRQLCVSSSLSSIVDGGHIGSPTIRC